MELVSAAWGRFLAGAPNNTPVIAANTISVTVTVAPPQHVWYPTSQATQQVHAKMVFAKRSVKDRLAQHAQRCIMGQPTEGHAQYAVRRMSIVTLQKENVAFTEQWTGCKITFVIRTPVPAQAAQVRHVQDTLLDAHTLGLSVPRLATKPTLRRVNE